MLKAKQSGTTPTNPDQSLLAFKPRQVLLIEQSSKTNAMKNCDSNSSSSSKSRALNADQKALLLHSVLRYLEHNGFSRTLKRLLSEAQIENDKWKTCSLDLEDMCGKYLPIDSNQSGTANKFAESAKNSRDILTNNLLANSNIELKEKKKTKKISNSFCQTEQVSAQALMEATVDAVCERKTDESTKKQDKKKKKSKSISESIDGNVEEVHLDILPAVNEEKGKKLKPSTGECKIDSEAEVKLKDKKKKIKVAAEDKSKDLASSTGNNKTDSKAEGKPGDKKKKKQSMDPLYENPISSDSEKESLKASEQVLYEDKKSSRKRKRLENEGQPGDILAIEELKRRKTELFEGTKSHGKLTEANVITGDNDHAGKEKKGENGHVGQNKLQNTSIKQLEVQANGKLTKNGEKSAAQKKGAKQCNGSVEPKTVNAFQRVKLDNVEFAHEKLQDNSYWAKDASEVGYGAKAQEILGQVRGRDFRHEKTKKKRGSYRGGQIDLQSHSVKFNYSDDD